jgi:hypothetical protein
MRPRSRRDFLNANRARFEAASLSCRLAVESNWRLNADSNSFNPSSSDWNSLANSLLLAFFLFISWGADPPPSVLGDLNGCGQQTAASVEGQSVSASQFAVNLASKSSKSGSSHLAICATKPCQTSAQAVPGFGSVCSTVVFRPTGLVPIWKKAGSAIPSVMPRRVPLTLQFTCEKQAEPARCPRKKPIPKKPQNSRKLPKTPQSCGWTGRRIFIGTIFA